jgi:hypothetical protein
LGWPVPGAMSNWFAFTVALLLLASADVPGVERLRPSVGPTVTFPAGADIPVLPEFTSTVDENQTQGPSQVPGAPRSQTLQDQSKLDLIRAVSGEFAKALKSLPAGKEGFLIYVGQPIRFELLDRAVANHGAAINSGDNVQITKLDFRAHSIVVDVNGGGRGKRHWRDRVQIGMGGIPTGTVTPQDSGPPGLEPGVGSSIFLEFNKTIPDLTPEDLKKILSPLMDFSRQRSASVQWADTLPPEMRKAIQDRRPALGMDREEVIAAIGKPEHKVRERDSEGYDIEDWIYGQPPSKIVFVRFRGERVTSIRQFPQ